MKIILVLFLVIASAKVGSRVVDPNLPDPGILIVTGSVFEKAQMRIQAELLDPKSPYNQTFHSISIYI